MWSRISTKELVKDRARFEEISKFSIILLRIMDVEVSFIKNVSSSSFEGMTFDHDFYFVVGKQCRTVNAYAGHQHNIFI